MRTLTHVPLALAGVLILGLLVACALIVWVAVAIRTRLGRARPAEAGTESVGRALGATGPGVVSLVSTTPGPALAALTPDDPIAHHIDTAAALLSPASPVERDGEFADAVERWLYAATAACINCGMLIEDAHYGAELPLWQHVASRFVGCPDGGLFAAPRPTVVP